MFLWCRELALKADLSASGGRRCFKGTCCGACTHVVECFRAGCEGGGGPCLHLIDEGQNRKCRSCGDLCHHRLAHIFPALSQEDIQNDPVLKNAGGHRQTNAADLVWVVRNNSDA